ncbi:MAG: TIGR00282 family metallophosphoesterase [Candidatus Cloacimonadaceae bacterium]|jgi:metallophosphoesterase (TIGR00282 family)|nr:TIGR00282 family metallophosphoesterase [Candidatus Cloacimonadota bacterium]MDD4033926.1 TIGR00282 family metallophosphoesterase [Candidatus Cloacimonadota bacterium]MDY0337212.1 TIGR00282 family metallophosphoesterase [Candidatus Cloacimonadaceae bacterium]HPF08814.1 TIGR00282 family metallophosphoesterase [Candidatus Cloacimonadota bacterium]
MKILFFGDVFGKPGRELLLQELSKLRWEFEADFVIINAENLADGRGITEKVAKSLWSAGVDAMTSGNHLWDREEAIEYIIKEKRLVRPLNYPFNTPGNMLCRLEKNQHRLDLICLTGQIFMPPCDSAFHAFDEFMTRRSEPEVSLLVDFHAESTAEKRALAWHLDGKVAALVGTHTHIQTADAEIMPQGTAYITDVGMTGAHDSVIGVKKHIVLERFHTNVPHRFETSDRGLMINAVWIELDDQTGKAIKIKNIRRKQELI